MKPAKIGLPIAEIIAIGTAKCDGDLAASIVHSSPNVKLEPADQLALRIAERARQAADHAESAFPFAHLQICYPRVHVLVERKISVVLGQRAVDQLGGVGAMLGVEHGRIRVRRGRHHRIGDIKRGITARGLILTRPGADRDAYLISRLRRAGAEQRGQKRCR